MKSELRIGNYIQDSNSGNIIEASFSTLEAVNYNRGIYNGITLTEQWLRDFNFFRSHTSGYTEWSHQSFRQYTIRINKKNEYFAVWYGSSVLVEGKNVHQLQNIIFYLTNGIELEKK